MSTNPYSAYLESSVQSASPLQLVHLAYQGAIEAIINARRHLAQKQIVERSNAITKAQLIITELNRGLDFQRGGDTAKRLASLYTYVLKRLIEANFKQIEQPLIEVQGLLETIDEAWKELAAPQTVAASATATAASVNPWATSMETTSRIDYSL